MYKGVKHESRGISVVEEMVRREAARCPATKRVFLADGDVMCRPFDELREILSILGQQLPCLTRVSLYANGSSILAKTPDELRELKHLKLHTLYMGLESGSEKILERCRKRESAAQMVQAGILAQSCGLRMSVMVLLGLGGVGDSAIHSSETARVINEMRPRLLSALRFVPIEGTALHRDVQNGSFKQLTEEGVVRELRDTVAGLDLSNTVFRANHTSNVVPVEARFPRDKQSLIRELDRMLASVFLDANSPGRLPFSL